MKIHLVLLNSKNPLFLFVLKTPLGLDLLQNYFCTLGERGACFGVHGNSIAAFPFTPYPTTARSLLQILL